MISHHHQRHGYSPIVIFLLAFRVIMSILGVHLFWDNQILLGLSSESENFHYNIIEYFPLKNDTQNTVPSAYNSSLDLMKGHQNQPLSTFTSKRRKIIAISNPEAYRNNTKQQVAFLCNRRKFTWRRKHNVVCFQINNNLYHIQFTNYSYTHLSFHFT